MTRVTPRGCVFVALAAALALSACGRIWYDPLPRGDGGASADAAIEGGVAVDAASMDAGPVFDAGPFHDAGELDASTSATDAASLDGAASPDAGSRACIGDIMDSCPSSAVSVGTSSSIVRSGSTVGFTDMMSGACGGVGVGEYNLQLLALTAGRYTIRATTDFDAVMYVRRESCGGTEDGCVDATVGPGDETYVINATSSGRWTVFVDGRDADACGSATLRITGAPGGGG